MRSFSILMLVLAPLAGCAGINRHQRTALASSPSHVLQNVPFFADSTDQCGPSTLAAMLTFWGRPTDPSELKKEIYLPDIKGTLPMDLLPAVEARGLRGDVVNTDVNGLKVEILAGRPVLAYLNLGYSFYPKGHYVLVTGFDDARRGLFMHSGLKANKFVTYRRFLRSWNKTDRWALLVQPKKIPVPGGL